MQYAKMKLIFIVVFMSCSWEFLLAFAGQEQQVNNKAKQLDKLHDNDNAAISSQTNTRSDQRVKLQVYFESLCPDSFRFFRNQLRPTVKELGESRLDVELVPFGKAHVSSTRFSCQHGPSECDGNRIMACVNERGKTLESRVDTITCLFGGPSDELESCINNHMPSVSLSEIENCRKGQESWQLMEVNARKTGKLSYVPHLVVNGNGNSTVQEQCETDLTNCLCQRMEPSLACPARPAKGVPEL